MGRLQLIFCRKSHCGILATPPVSFNLPMFLLSLGMINAYRKIRHVAQPSHKLSANIFCQQSLVHSLLDHPVKRPSKSMQQRMPPRAISMGAESLEALFWLVYSEITKLFCSLPYCERKDKSFVEHWADITPYITYLYVPTVCAN